MRYYTNIFRNGSRLLVREVKDGKRRRFKVEYKPTLYIPTKQPPSKHQRQFHAPDGTPVEPIQPGNMGDCYKFIEQYKDVDNFKVYGNTSYEYAYINEEYPGPIEYNSNDLVIANIDIEVDSKNGYAEARTAGNEVIAITMKSSKDGIFHVFACQPFDDVAYNEAHQDSVIIYHYCDDEHEMLMAFLDLWETLEPDIVTGWNIRMYDIPYLVNRISVVCSADDANRLSPWSIIRESTVNIFGKPEVVYDVAGVSVIDYLLIYRKNVLEPRESYRLDYIAQVELGEHKVDYGEYANLQALYENNFNKFIEYNIHDVRLVDRIEAKRKLIELQLVVAYHAKINYVDVLSQVKMWDTNICNHLLSQGVVVPQKGSPDKNTQFTGAYVMKPIPGMYEWIASFDVQSLYPMIMRTLNIGMESKLEYANLTPEMRRYLSYINSNLMIADEDGKLNVNVAAITGTDIVNKSGLVNSSVILAGLTEEFLTHLQEHDVTVGANAVFYRRDPKSFYSVLIEDLFASRLEYKAKMKAAKKELSTCTDPIRKVELETTVSIFDLKQHATKIMLNSLYGAMGNQFFRFFDVKNAEAVTTTGQFIIQYIGQGINAYLNKMMKTQGKQFVVYSDTDSVYVTLKDVVNKHHPHGDVMQKVNFVDKLCKEAIQSEINRLFRLLTERYMNGVGEYLLMNREVIGDKGIWTAKKRYLVNVRDKEGIRKEKGELKYMGVEIKKTTVPKFCRDAMEEAVRIVMEEDQKALFKFVAETKMKFKSQAIEDVSFPRGVNGLEKYGDSVTIFKKGTPFHVKGVLAYNMMIDRMGLIGNYSKIKDGEKMKFFYLLQPNPFGTNSMAFLTKLPAEFKAEKYIDWETQWEKSFIEPLMLILNAIKWDTQPRASLDSIFGDDDDEAPKPIDLSHLEDDEEVWSDDDCDGINVASGE